LGVNVTEKKLQHFYIAEEQSIYLLSHKDAEKLKQWVELCKLQLTELGYQNITLLGKGAYGFVFNGESKNGHNVVFKFSRINLPQHVQDRLADEAEIQSELNHPQIPKVIEYHKIKRQCILHMSRAPGVDLDVYSHLHGPLAPELVVSITIQLAEILLFLRNSTLHKKGKPYVHGDIKPSNVVYDEITGSVHLVDWGSSVLAQMDEYGQSTSNNIMDLMSSDLQHTNARLGDVYFIGAEQLNGALSSPRFDEQGLAATIYAIASGQSCRYGSNVITPTSLGLPKLLAKILEGMLSQNEKIRQQAGDYFFKHLEQLKQVYLSPQYPPLKIAPLIPVWVKPKVDEIDTVVYGSRKSFLRATSDQDSLTGINDVQLEKYYKNFLMGMGDSEKAFIAAVGRLSDFPVVGGLVIHWDKAGVYIDSNLTLFDQTLQTSFQSAVNNMIHLAQGIFHVGTFKSCLFNARNTLHIERDSESYPFEVKENQVIPFEISAIPEIDDVTRLHSYFEDGKDPDEYLHLPEDIMIVLTRMNLIHHTGCIIFEVLPTHLKIHSYLMLLNHDKKQEFADCLAEILALLPLISGQGISGFMKLPYKDTRFFEHISELPEHFYPKNPKLTTTLNG
jgi:non-specific serine/threonine protein kinase